MTWILMCGRYDLGGSSDRLSDLAQAIPLGAELGPICSRRLPSSSTPGERRRQAIYRFSRVRESMVCVSPGCQIEADSAHDGQHGF
jgi:hypothetical protein